MIRLHGRIQALCLLMLFLAVILCAGIAYGRYCSTLQQVVGFEAVLVDSTRALSIRSENGWQRTEATATLTFHLENGGAANQRACLRLTATEAFPANTVVTLAVGNTVYTAVPQAVEEGSPLYSKIGRGTEFRFYDTEGREMTCAVSGTQEMTLSVEGASEAALLRLTATEA